MGPLVVTTDDLCLEYIPNFKYFDLLKDKYKDLEVIAFTISNFRNKENLTSNPDFKDWLKDRPWVYIAVHSFDHLYPPDGDRDDLKQWITKARDGLAEYLPKQYGYRAPGWQVTNKTVDILRDLGFHFIAYETKIVDMDYNVLSNNILNSHLYDVSSIKRIEEVLDNEALQS